jgi:hypothetical protein
VAERPEWLTVKVPRKTYDQARRLQGRFLQFGYEHFDALGDETGQSLGSVFAAAVALLDRHTDGKRRPTKSLKIRRRR